MAQTQTSGFDTRNGVNYNIQTNATNNVSSLNNNMTQVSSSNFTSQNILYLYSIKLTIYLL
jgi:hypothetical protein